jgi:cell division protein FtsB
MFETNPMPAPAGISPVEHHEAVATEVRKRHWQRWVFYGLIIILFIGGTLLILKIYNDNSNLLLTVTQTKEQLAQASADVVKKEAEIKQIDESLKKAQEELNQKTEQYKKDIEGGTTVKDLDQCKLELTSAEANVYNLILQLGVGISNVNLQKIAIADANLSSGTDTDTDGLADEVETALGTKVDNADTDGDGFKDKDEILSGFDPLVKGGKLPLDAKFAAGEKGKILIAIEGNKDAWYVSPADGKRYFLGRPADAYKAMRSIEFWTKSYKQQ